MTRPTSPGSYSHVADRHTIPGVGNGSGREPPQREHDCTKEGPIASIEGRIDQLEADRSEDRRKLDDVHEALLGRLGDDTRPGLVAHVRELVAARKRDEGRRKQMRGWALGIAASLILAISGVVIHYAEARLVRPAQAQQQHAPSGAQR